MPSKRRRTEAADLGARDSTSQRPLSAVAAARLRADAAAKGIVTPELTVEPVAFSTAQFPNDDGFGMEVSDSEDEPAAIKQNLKLCNWRLEPQNILSETDSEITVKLNKHSTISLIGCYHFKVLKGAINIYGANIGAVSRSGHENQVNTAYAPATQPIVRIRGLDTTNHVQFSHCKGLATLVDVNPLFMDIWNTGMESKSTRSFTIITESDADPLHRPLSPEMYPEDWLRAIENSANSPAIVTVVGPPSTGKSTFAKRLLNRYLTGQGRSARPLPAVFYLDLDPSKPEYTPHGQISLVVVRRLNLGPSFTHPSALPNAQETGNNYVIRAHAMPSSLNDFKKYYLACAEDLFLTYKQLQARDATIPLIVNTSGSLYSTNLETMVDLLARIKPHHVALMGSTQAITAEAASKLGVLQTATSHCRGTLHEVTAQSPVATPLRSEIELNTMHMESYFHLRTSGNSSEHQASSWTTESLCNLVPWEFCWQETNERSQDFVGFAIHSEPVESSSLVHALNGSLIQIVQSTSSAIPSTYTELPRTPQHNIPYIAKCNRTGIVEPLDPKATNIVLTALIRGFDLKTKVVQILVPKTHESLLHNLVSRQTVFVSGVCEMPEWAYSEYLYIKERIAQSVKLTSNANKAQLAPWLEEAGTIDDMGYLSTVRRVRKYQT